MKQVITDCGNDVTLDFQWDSNWRLKAGPSPFKALSDYTLTKKGNWDELCYALAELMTVNGAKMSTAELSTQLHGEFACLNVL